MRPVGHTGPPFHQNHPNGLVSWHVRVGQYRHGLLLLIGLLLLNDRSRDRIREGFVILFEPRPHLKGDRSDERFNLSVKVLFGQFRCHGRLRGRND